MSYAIEIIPEIIVPGKRLGRHLDRGPVFDAHVVEAKGTEVLSKKWTRHVGPFDQGQVGSCVGNAAEGCLATDPFYIAGKTYDEPGAVQIYEWSSAISSPGNSYPPNDCGSSGPASGQALENAHLISSYTHAVDLDGLLEGLQTAPASIGVPWMTTFDAPLGTGELQLTGASTVRGGHELEAEEVDVENQRVWITNSWGLSWSLQGRAWFSYATLTSLFQQGADATFFIKL
jgi:hypothetical protein